MRWFGSYIRLPLHSQTKVEEIIWYLNNLFCRNTCHNLITPFTLDSNIPQGYTVYINLIMPEGLARVYKLTQHVPALIPTPLTLGTNNSSQNGSNRCAEDWSNPKYIGIENSPQESRKTSKTGLTMQQPNFVQHVSPRQLDPQSCQTPLWSRWQLVHHMGQCLL